jgi:hypothetical protein
MSQHHTYHNHHRSAYLQLLALLLAHLPACLL